MVSSATYWSEDSWPKKRQMNVRPNQVNAHHYGKRHPQENRKQGQQEILDTDDLVIDAEDVLADKACRRRVGVRDASV
jgi:phosphoribosylaminoimidazole carboxylase (NCAIR synthetase)